MAFKIFLDNKHIVIQNEPSGSKAACLDLYSFSYSLLQTEDLVDYIKLTDSTGTAVSMLLADAQDEDGNTFASFALLTEYLSSISKQVPNLGKNIRLDNIELSSTGGSFKVKNLNTDIESFLVKRRVESDVTKVFYTEQTTALQVETSADAYQPYTTHTGGGTLNAQNRYALAIDIAVISDTFISEYRSILNTGIENLNIKIFNVTQTPSDATKYRTLAGAGIDAGWYISKKPYWTLNKQATIDTKAGQNIAAGNATLDFEEGFSLNAGEHYRFVISGDNDFEFQGVDGAPSAFGGTQFIPYIERSFTGEQEKEIVKQDDLNASANEYSLIVDADYTGTAQTGTAFEPYSDLATAIANSSQDDTILVKGTHIITSEISLPHGLEFIGAQKATIKYATYDATNADLMQFDGTDNTQTFRFKNIEFKNAGGYGLYIKKTLKTVIVDCKFSNNGWNGTALNTVVPAATFGLLGYDSAQADLQAFYAGSNASNGGAMRIQEATQVEIINNNVSNNLRGIRLQDCGVNGYGFVTRNVASQNIESGIYLAAGSTYYGCQNIIVTINSSAYNANNGLLCIGGLNNKFSQNEVNGNWNAGACFWGAANSTLRDCGLYDNNRSTYNGIGNTGDAKASIQINEAYNLLGTSISLNPAARFIAEVLDTQVHYTGLGSNTEKIGFLITSGVGALADNPKNIIKVDDVGFIGQDYAIDFSEVDLTNLRISLGDNSYQSIGLKAVKAPLNGNYSELPFSNHVMQVPEVDVVVDTLKQTIALHEGVGGNVINVYNTNELQSVLKANSVDIIQRSSDKIQLRDCTLGNVYINGVVAGSNINTLNDSLNAAFNMSLVQYKEFLESEVGVEGSGDSATFYYIESPDNNFEYPLFKTQAEAEAFSTANGGSGFNTETYADDLTNTTWYVPTVLFVNNATEAPLNGVYGTSTSIVWNIQTTDIDSNYVPTFTDITYTIEEGSAVNIQYKAQGMTETFNVTNVPAGYADNGTAIIGTAETITDGVDIQHVINVTKANDFGSDTGTITLNVTDDPTNNVSQNETPWTKALDFSGGNEHALKVNTWSGSSPLLMDSISQVLAGPSTVGNTTNVGNARPWATAIVFQSKNVTSNQHIWNSGEGAGSVDDNIYLRVTGTNGNLYFGWGRQGAINECLIGNIGGSANASHWWGIYVGYNGTRLSGSNATAANLADVFDIRLMGSNDGPSAWAGLYDVGTEADWTAGSTGGRMDRAFVGNFTIGGRGSNRNFHGKVASMVVTTLRLGVAMPTDAEIRMMITDPKKWEDDYRVGQTVRRSQGSSNVTYANSSVYNGHGGTQIWLMGDGTSDSYANGIRNDVYAADQNYGKLQLNSMISNDIQTVNINGLT